MTHLIEVDELNNIFITADQHFGHENIIKFCNRPFKTTEEMDKMLIENWNKTVGSDDIIYHLGDFTLGNFKIAKDYFKQLNGKIQVLGNHWHHDKRWLPKDYFGPLTLEYPDAIMDVGHVNIIPPIVVLELEGMGDNGRSLGVTLCHYPLEIWDRKHYGAWHLHGHTHKHGAIGPYRLNIGVDCQNFTPISLGSVLHYMYELGW
jgi:calcineurin-like phosphoesterase family protein